MAFNPITGREEEDAPGPFVAPSALPPPSVLPPSADQQAQLLAFVDPAGAARAADRQAFAGDVLGAAPPAPIAPVAPDAPLPKPAGLSAPGEERRVLLPEPAPPSDPAPTLPTPGASQPATTRHRTGGAAPATAAPPVVTGPTDADRAAVLTRQEGAAKGVATAGVEKSNDLVKLGNEEEAEVKKVDTWAETTRREAHEHLTKSRDEIAAFKATDLFEGREAARVTAWIAAGIGQIGAALSGGPNTALQVLTSAADSWERKETQRYQRLVAKGEMSKEDMEIAEVEIKNRKSGVLESFARQRTTLIAKVEGKEAAAKGDVVTAALAKQALDDKAQAAEKAEELVMKKKQLQLQEITARASAAASYANAGESKARAELARAQAENGGKAGTQDQAKAAGFAERMANQAEVLRSLPPLSAKDRDTILKDIAREALLEKNPAAKLAAMETGNYKTIEQKLGDNGRAYYQAAREFISANLRRESGAAIAEHEVQDALKRFLPVQGDKPADVARKRQALDDVTRGALREAGPMGRQIQVRQAQPAAQAASPQAIAQAQQWLNNNPNDPRASAVRAKIREAARGAIQP